METSATALPHTSAEPENKPSLGLGATLRRFLTPGFVVTLQGLMKFGAKISPKSEVAATRLLTASIVAANVMFPLAAVSAASAPMSQAHPASPSTPRPEDPGARTPPSPELARLASGDSLRGTVVGRDVLTRSGWPEKEPGRSLLLLECHRRDRRDHGRTAARGGRSAHLA